VIARIITGTPAPGWPRIAWGRAAMVSVAAGWLGMAAPAAGASPVAIYQFQAADPGEPGYLSSAPDGGLYGISNSEVYELIPPAGGKGRWQKQRLWGFPAATTAAGPVTPDKNGNLFGVTSASSVSLYGFAFELSPPTQGAKWTEHTLYDFPDEPHGAQPSGGLVVDQHDALYGANAGVVFRLTPPTSGQGAWTETTLASFNGGINAPLLLGADGSLFGTTQSGGTASLGSVFQLSPPPHGQSDWTLTTLFSFTGFENGFVPGAGLISDSSGALYGTTMNNGGTAFRLNPPVAGQTDWTISILWIFDAAPDCQQMKSPLIRADDGDLYGIAPFGGDVQNGLGCLFRLNPPAPGQTNWTETILWNFDGLANDGYLPYGNLILQSRWLYGVSEGGGANQAGVAFKLRP